MTSGSPIRLLVHGARGKMGARIVDLAQQNATFLVIAALDHGDDSAASAAQMIDVIIDFSSDEGAQRAATLAAHHRAALLVGTTGLSANTIAAITETAQRVPAMIAPNTSRGVAVLNHLITRAAQLLGPEYHIDLIESHHIHKRDAPSGTAKRLLHSLRENVGIELPADRVHCIRAGEIIGEHTVQFAGPGEVISLTHAASHRDLFARGALHAAAWLRSQKAGLYTIEQSLGLE